MKVSIITITFNSEATLEQTILSVIDQSYKDIEYIIVDGKSTDNTLNIINKYRNKVAKLISEKDTGLYDALNKGIDMASGNIIGLLHSDDFYMDNHVIEKYVSLFEKTNCEAVYSDLYYVDKNDTNKIIRKWKSGNYSTGAFLNGWMPPHPTFFVRKEIYLKHGKFNLSFKTSADYELMLRFMYKYKVKTLYLPIYSVKMRIGGVSNITFKNRLIANKEDRRAWRINELKPRFYTLYLKPLRKVLQFF